MKKKKPNKSKLLTGAAAFKLAKDLIDTYITQAGIVLDEHEAPQALVDALAKLDVEIEKKLNDIELQETAEEIARDTDLVEDVLFEYEFSHVQPTDIIKERCRDITESNGYTCILAPSLVEQIKVDAFIEQLQANPYQLSVL